MPKFIITTILLLACTNGFTMLRALNTAATGMTAQEANVNTISNNIANVNTIGFKKGRAEFEDLLYETIRNPGSRSSATTRYNVGTQIGSGATISAVRKSFGQGSPQITQNPFDLMINGDGFFAIIMPNNQLRYSRDGAFNVDNQGTLVTQNGYKVFPGITLPPNTKNVVVSENGNMDVYISNQVQPSMVGTIPLFTFANPVGLKSAGGNLYLMTESSGQAMQSVAGQGHVGTIMQGALESSNVSIMTEMTSLIKAQRAYEMNSKVMGVADQMLQTVNSIR